MKELVRYLLSGGVIAVLVLAALVFGGVTFIPKLFADAAESQAAEATDMPAPNEDVAVEPLEYNDLGQVITEEAAEDLWRPDGEQATVTPEYTGVACVPAADCAPTFTVLGQYCQGGEPYTNVEASSIGELDLHPPEPGRWANAKPGTNPAS